MNFKDQWATNENGDKFVFTVGMQRKLQEAGLPVEPEALERLPDEVASGERQASKPQSQSRPATEKTDGNNFTEPLTIQIDPQTGKYVGRMKWYNVKKGYGFIVRGGGEEIFFHKSGAVGDAAEIKEGQWILYDVEETRKGPEATEIEPYEGDTDQLT
ncbi:MAG: cold shock domain-containing protein [Chloroflexi bacterium]|nr:cold shock domain-containing protein [Chloroflexota bacterium]